MDKITVSNLDLYYGEFKALKNINLNIPEKEITAFIGPSGCGKINQQDERYCGRVQDRRGNTFKRR